MNSKIAMNLFFLGALVSCAHKQNLPETDPDAATSFVRIAVNTANIALEDSLDVKVKKTLTLINQQRYFAPETNGVSSVSPPFDNPYHLDSLRTPEEILKQKVGGYCGSAALVFAAMMRASGVPNEDLYVVAGVYLKDLKIICPKKNHLRVENPKTGASGHVFVAVNFPDRGWRLINTIDGSNYESVPWYSQEEVIQKMKQGPLTIPFAAYQKFPPRLRSLPMVAFQSWRSDQVPLHTFDQRLDLIASGKMTQSPHDPNLREAKTCRYDMTDFSKIR